MWLSLTSQLLITEAEVQSVPSTSVCRRLLSWILSHSTLYNFESLKNPWPINCLHWDASNTIFLRGLEKVTDSPWKDPKSSVNMVCSCGVPVPVECASLFFFFFWTSREKCLSGTSITWPCLSIISLAVCRSVNTAWMPGLVLKSK